MATIREFITKWGFDVDDAQLKRLDRGVTRVQKNLRATARAAVDLGKKLSFGVTLPVVGIGAAFIKAASDAEETSSKFATVFQDVRKESELVAKDLSRNFGLSNDASKELLSATGDLLTGFKFSGEQALDLSEKVNKLAIDLASFTNLTGGAEQASKALTKALLGERESIKTLGIAILEEDVKAKVKALPGVRGYVAALYPGSTSQRCQERLAARSRNRPFAAQYQHPFELPALLWTHQTGISRTLLLLLHRLPENRAHPPGSRERARRGP